MDHDGGTSMSLPAPWGRRLAGHRAGHYRTVLNKGMNGQKHRDSQNDKNMFSFRFIIGNTPHCGKQNDALHPKEVRVQTWKLWLRYLTRKKELCRCGWATDLEIILDYSWESTWALKSREPLPAVLRWRCDDGRRLREAMLLALEVEKGGPEPWWSIQLRETRSWIFP